MLLFSGGLEKVMKKIILKNLKELFSLFIINIGITLILSIVFQRNGFISSTYKITSSVFFISAIVYEIIRTINDCKKN